MNRRVRIELEPWDDFEFHAAFERACDGIRCSDVVLDSRVAAERCQAALRAEGFPRAVIEYRRSVDDVFQGLAHWIVRRDGLTSPSPSPLAPSPFALHPGSADRG